jgi:hypothetical protein
MSKGWGGTPNHCTGDLVISDNVRLEFLPPYSPELNPQWTRGRHIEAGGPFSPLSG